MYTNISCVPDIEDFLINLLRIVIILGGVMPPVRYGKTAWLLTISTENQQTDAGIGCCVELNFPIFACQSYYKWNDIYYI